MISNDKLYENIIKTEKEAYGAQDLLLDSIKDWFSEIMNQEESDNTKIILAQGGYIQIRTVKGLAEQEIIEFMNEFYFKRVWMKKEDMTDFRNTEVVSVTVYEYAFLPKDIKKLLGDNQVDFGD